MSCRTYLWFSGSIFGVVAALHVVRLINGWPFQVGPWSLPVAALVGWCRSRGRSVSLGLSTVRSRIGELCCFPSQPYSDWVARCERASLSVRRSARSTWVERALRARLRAQ